MTSLVEVLVEVEFDIINGVKLGIEHISVDDDDHPVDYLIAIDLFFFRIGLIKYKN